MTNLEITTRPPTVELLCFLSFPVTYEDMQNLAAWIKATITGLSQLLKDNAQLIAMDADPTGNRVK